MIADELTWFSNICLCITSRIPAVPQAAKFSRFRLCHRGLLTTHSIASTNSASGPIRSTRFWDNRISILFLSPCSTLHPSHPILTLPTPASEFEDASEKSITSRSLTQHRLCSHPTLDLVLQVTPLEARTPIRRASTSSTPPSNGFEHTGQCKIRSFRLILSSIGPEIHRLAERLASLGSLLRALTNRETRHKCGKKGCGTSAISIPYPSVSFGNHNLINVLQLILYPLLPSMTLSLFCTEASNRCVRATLAIDSYTRNGAKKGTTETSATTMRTLLTH